MIYALSEYIIIVPPSPKPRDEVKIDWLIVILFDCRPANIAPPFTANELLKVVLNI